MPSVLRGVRDAPRRGPLHVVFATKRPRRWITGEVVLRSSVPKDGMVLATGGVEDHVHLYFRSRTDGTIAELVRLLKSRSTTRLLRCGADEGAAEAIDFEREV